MTDMERINTVADIVTNRRNLRFYGTERVDVVIRKMRKHHACAAAIIDADDRLVGMTTEHDILYGFYNKLREPRNFYGQLYNLPISIDTLTAWDVTIRNPKCLTMEMDLEKALSIITRHGFRFMPVVYSDDRHKLAGIVSERELFWQTKHNMHRQLRQKDSMLSYFTGHEPYGHCSIEN